LCAAPGCHARFADAVTRDEAMADARFLAERALMDKTSPDPPRAWLLRVGFGSGARLLQLFDVGGEAFSEASKVARLRYLAHARTYVLVIDPLAVGDLWFGLSARQRAEFASVRSDEESPEVAYQRAHQELERMGVPLGRARLAVVISRGDLLDRPQGEDQEEWAVVHLGLGNLIRSARHQFADVRVFVVASVMDGSSRVDPSVAAFARWALASAGLPENTGPTRALSAGELAGRYETAGTGPDYG
jgi:hypothetical protein